MRTPVHWVDVDRPETWTRYRPGLCSGCAANCCTMPVEVTLADLVGLGWVEAFEAEHESPQRIAKRLQQSRQVERYHAKSEKFSLARRASGDCHLLDPDTRLCTVYAQRPQTCRDHPKVGPRPGHCPHGPQRGSRVLKAK